MSGPSIDHAAKVLMSHAHSVSTSNEPLTAAEQAASAVVGAFLASCTPEDVAARTAAVSEADADAVLWVLRRAAQP